jgi:hypothetical protein
MTTAEILAQRLWGKSHYFDASTRRWFSARIGSERAWGADGACRVDDSECCFVGLVESTASASWNIARSYRAIVVLLDAGEVIDLDDAGPALGRASGTGRAAAARRLARHWAVATGLELAFGPSRRLRRERQAEDAKRQKRWERKLARARRAAERESA